VQSRGCPLELEGADALAIEVIRLGSRQHDQAGASLVQSIDQGDEAARRFATVRPQYGHILQEEGIEPLGKRQVV